MQAAVETVPAQIRSGAERLREEGSERADRLREGGAVIVAREFLVNREGYAVGDSFEVICEPTDLIAVRNAVTEAS